MRLCSCNNPYEIACAALPAFGAGVLLTMFLPPVVLVGACAAAAIGFGVLCFISK